jgi:hypoxanthine-DNA glycosylase
MAKAGRDLDTSAVRGFPPLADARARVLVLGSMPGVASLRAQQYYGHPRNAFWPIMGDIFGFDAAAPYPQRVAALQAHRVAVWDVLATCERPGSLDADIDLRSVVVNDFAGFLASHPQLQRLCFNGAMAQTMFRRHVLPSLAVPSAFDMVRLPSTSPANAGMRLADKRRAWQAVVADAAGSRARDSQG